MKGSLPKRVHVCCVQLLFLTEKKVVILLARLPQPQDPINLPTDLATLSLDLARGKGPTEASTGPNASSRRRSRMQRPAARPATLGLLLPSEAACALW